MGNNMCCKHKKNRNRIEKESDRLLWMMSNMLLDIHEKSLIHPIGEDTVTNKNPCISCLCNERQILSANCGHLCLCFECSKIIFNSNQKCPMCRGNWTNLVKVYN
jgi:hypothetical protein